MIRFEIDDALFGVADAWRHLIAVDPQAQMALSQFGEAAEAARAEQAAATTKAPTEAIRRRSFDHNRLWGQFALAPIARPC